MNIGRAARESGLPPKTIRYYEEIGLIRPDRRDNNYRDYSDTLVESLRFLQRARKLGFSIEGCRQLLSLHTDKRRASADVRLLAERHIGDIDARMAELQAMRKTLSMLVEACHGDHRPDSPILEDLARR